MVDLLKSDAPRKAMAMMLALATALGPISIPAFAADNAGPGDGDTHQTPGCDIPGERFVRPLFWNVPSGDESRR